MHHLARNSRSWFGALALSSALGLTLACGGGGDTAAVVAPQVAAPTNLSYSSPTINGLVGTAIPNSVPTVTGTVTSWSISPALPAGLAFSSATGVISGTPTAVSPQATYTITASNSGGSVTATVVISVAAPLKPPTNLTYSAPTINATVGTAIPKSIPTVSGTVTAWSVTPALPAGLALEALSGEIAGTPTAVTPQATYTVRASNAAGHTETTLTITVVAPGPPTAVTQTAGVLQSFMTSMSYMMLPGVPPLHPVREGSSDPAVMPLLVPAPMTSACPAITTSPDFSTTTADFSGCPNMRGSITVTYTYGASGYVGTISYNRFGYDFGAGYSGSVDGTITVAGHVVGTQAFSYTIQTTGLSVTSTVNGATVSFTEAMNLTIGLTVSGSTMTMTEWGTFSFTGSLGTFSATIPSGSPLTWNLPTCFFPTSGTISFQANGTPCTVVFGPSCGAYSINGWPFSLNH